MKFLYILLFAALTHISMIFAAPSDSNFRPPLKGPESVRELSLEPDAVADLLAAAKIISPPNPGAPYTASGQLELKWTNGDTPDPDDPKLEYPNYIVVGKLNIGGKSELLNSGNPVRSLRPIVKKIVSIAGELEELFVVGRNNSIVIPFNLSSVSSMEGDGTTDIAAVVLSVNLSGQNASSILGRALQRSVVKKSSAIRGTRGLQKGILTINRKPGDTSESKYSAVVTLKSNKRTLSAEKSAKLAKYIEGFAPSITDPTVEETSSLPFVNAGFQGQKKVARCELILVRLTNLDFAQ